VHGSGGSEGSEYQDDHEADGEESDEGQEGDDDPGSDVTEHDDQPDNDLHDCHGQQWTRAPDEGVRVDARKDASGPLPRMPPKLLQGGDRSPLGLALKLIPKEWIDLILKYTNAGILADVGEASDKLHQVLSRGEVYQLFGMMLAITIASGKPVLDMWSTKPCDFDILPPPSFGRHGMTKNRFLFLKQRMRSYPQERPGWLLCVDESMCDWCGRSGFPDNPNTLPQLSWVPRKPEPMGCELKTTADALISVLTFVEPCMGK